MHLNCLYPVLAGLLLFSAALPAQEISLTETGWPAQAYKETVESEELLSFNDLGLERGYALYTSEINVAKEKSVLEIENVRDYAAVYLDGRFQGSATENRKELTLDVPPGKYVLRLYVENIGRVTYGPEITDNSKGLFGKVAVDGEVVGDWTIVPLDIQACDVSDLAFEKENACRLPAFHKGYFRLEAPRDAYLDISGWGMGEVWINGNHIGSYWEEEQQQSIRVSAENLLKGKNEIVVFDLKNNARKSMKLSDRPVFK